MDDEVQMNTADPISAAKIRSLWAAPADEAHK